MFVESLRQRKESIARWEGRVRFPRLDPGVDQHEEYCEIAVDDRWVPLRMHDYGKIFAEPGLYEYLFYDRLQCRSPSRVVGLLDDVRRDLDMKGEVRALDLGGGNGIVAETLRSYGITDVWGIDILEQARAAAERDRPGAYCGYIAGDICSLAERERRMLVDARLNTMTCVAALGFGDIPHQAFIAAVNLIEDGGLLAFNIKEAFLDAKYSFGFSHLIRTVLEQKICRLEASRRYVHRRSSQGVPIYYTAMVATKLRPIPVDLIG
ncbi:methyltransferase domain-containing protein [Sorangium sp. So ce281]|uniref:methyltransferase domain-containing protein n=1 Tax=unclassified Sorangium TaxID=2621164 RepID=UPI003F63478D